MKGTERKDSDRGTPQGRQISPVLANVYLHYVLDQWYEILIRRACKGEVYYTRYADDFLLLFQYENEAKAVMQMLKYRLGVRTSRKKIKAKKQASKGVAAD